MDWPSEPGASRPASRHRHVVGAVFRGTAPEASASPARPARHRRRLVAHPASRHPSTLRVVTVVADRWAPSGQHHVVADPEVRLPRRALQRQASSDRCARFPQSPTAGPASSATSSLTGGPARRQASSDRWARFPQRHAVADRSPPSATGALDLVASPRGTTSSGLRLVAASRNTTSSRRPPPLRRLQLRLPPATVGGVVVSTATDGCVASSPRDRRRRPSASRRRVCAIDGCTSSVHRPRRMPPSRHVVGDRASAPATEALRLRVASLATVRPLQRRCASAPHRATSLPTAAPSSATEALSLALRRRPELLSDYRSAASSLHRATSLPTAAPSSATEALSLAPRRRPELLSDHRSAASSLHRATSLPPRLPSPKHCPGASSPTGGSVRPPERCASSLHRATSFADRLPSPKHCPSRFVADRSSCPPASLHRQRHVVASIDGCNSSVHRPRRPPPSRHVVGDRASARATEALRLVTSSPVRPPPSRHVVDDRAPAPEALRLVASSRHLAADCSPVFRHRSTAPGASSPTGGPVRPPERGPSSLHRQRHVVASIDGYTSSVHRRAPPSRHVVGDRASDPATSATEALSLALRRRPGVLSGHRSAASRRFVAPATRSTLFHSWLRRRPEVLSGHRGAAPRRFSAPPRLPTVFRHRSTAPARRRRPEVLSDHRRAAPRRFIAPATSLPTAAPSSASEARPGAASRSTTASEDPSAATRRCVVAPSSRPRRPPAPVPSSHRSAPRIERPDSGCTRSSLAGSAGWARNVLRIRSFGPRDRPVFWNARLRPRRFTLPERHAFASSGSRHGATP